MAKRPQPRLLLTLIEAGEALGLSRRKMTYMAQSGELTVVRIGVRVYVRPSDLTAFVNDHVAGE